ncbi:response regulator [Asticcacaulis sp. 201]|uniref:response regulator n=1 Tax=Asticcacaulis sp. 201 TaxID=3028787 RepID=UPI0029163830|nr:response regulator [Asticcacaulis sp. 201]MDV6329532.1 response regulator [Asticcacaulis sp. 201]
MAKKVHGDKATDFTKLTLPTAFCHMAMIWWIHSRFPGVTVTFPSPQSSPSSRAAKPFRVLVVDDNVDAAESIKSVIEDFGYVVQSCWNGRDALTTARTFLPDVLLLDLSMPGMDGFEVAQVLRRDKALSRMKIIAQTGFSDDDSKRRTATSGFDLCLSKPLSVDRLDNMLMMLRAAA